MVHNNLFRLFIENTLCSEALWRLDLYVLSLIKDMMTSLALLHIRALRESRERLLVLVK